MKVLFVTRKFPPVVGGMELFAYDLSQALAGKLDLKLVKWSGQGRTKAVLVGVPYLTVKAFWTLLRGGVDVIHVQDGLLAPSAYVLSRLFGKPYVVVVHGLDMTYQRTLFKALVPAAIRRANAVICISQATADEVIKRGVAESKIAVIPLAVREPSRPGDPKQLKLPAGAPVLLTVGRLVKRKGAAWFIQEVLPALVRAHPELVYLVVGDGEDRGNVEAAVQKTGLAKNVRLLGRVSDELREAAYARADVFVMPNVNVPGDVEGFGLVLLEASVRDLPVVASDTEGIKDAVANGKNGVLAPTGDAKAFGREISRFVDDQALAAKFGAASRRYTLATYRWDKIAGRYVEIYRQTCN